MNSKRNGAKVRYQAARYVARLCSGEMNKQDQQQIRAWKRDKPVHASEFDLAARNWTCVSALADDPQILDLCAMSERPSAGARGLEFVAEYWPRLAAAAGVMLAVFVGFQSQFFNTNTVVDAELVSYQTRVGEQKTVTLSDGSVVVLNTASRLLLDYSDQRRRIILDKGEVFFDVVKDPARPFTVESGASAVTAIGTRFNVLNNREQLTVAVTDGMVALHPKEQIYATDAPLLVPKTTALKEPPTQSSTTANSSVHYRLGAGLVATHIVGPAAGWTVAKIAEPELVASWRQGFVSFDGQPLYQVVQEINRYTTRRIQIEDPTLMALKVNAVLHLNKVDSILTAFEASLPLTVKRYPDVIILSQRDR